MPNVRAVAPNAIHIPNTDYIRQSNPKLYEAIIALRNAIPNLQLSAPPQVASINVTATNGVFQATLVDAGNPVKGIGYFLEYDTSPAFPQPHVIDLGASRSWRGTLGNLTLYWRAYSQYAPPLDSPPSPTLAFGGNVTPTAVVGGGSSGPALPESTGSGTAATNGMQGGLGHGINLVRQ